jgi:hypothetical protein
MKEPYVKKPGKREHLALYAGLAGGLLLVFILLRRSQTATAANANTNTDPTFTMGAGAYIGGGAGGGGGTGSSGGGVTQTPFQPGAQPTSTAPPAPPASTAPQGDPTRPPVPLRATGAAARWLAGLGVPGVAGGNIPQWLVQVASGYYGPDVQAATARWLASQNVRGLLPLAIRGGPPPGILGGPQGGPGARAGGASGPAYQLTVAAR